MEGKDIDAHIYEMRKPDTYATNLEVVALSAILYCAIPIHAYYYKDPLVMLHESVVHIARVRSDRLPGRRPPPVGFHSSSALSSPAGQPKEFLT